MKNYKTIVPIVLVALYVLSIYMLISSRSDVRDQYEACLAEARTLKSEKIYVDAESKYREAMDIRDSKEINRELAEMFLEAGNNRKAFSQGETIVEKYPKEPDGYEFLVTAYNAQSDYTGCWIWYDKMVKRKVSSATVEETMATIENKYFFNCEYDDVGAYASGCCPVMIEGQWGYVDEKGNDVISTRYLEANAFSSNGTAGVKDIKQEIYFIDKEGNKKNSVPVENVKKVGFREGDIFPAYDGKAWNFYELSYRKNDETQVNEAFAEKLFGDFTEATSAGNGIAAGLKDSRWNLYDLDGNAIMREPIDGVVVDEKGIVCRNERIFVEQGASYLMVDRKGNTVGSGYQDAKTFNDNTYAAVKQSGKWGFVDADGSMVIEPQYEDAHSFSNGYAAVKQNGKWGYIDSGNNMIIEPSFEDAKEFNTKGASFVKEKNVWKLLRLYKYNHEE